MKPELQQVHMKNAENYATLSKASRAKVGAVLVTKTGIEVPGYNGTPIGCDNECEELVVNGINDYSLKTKSTVIHAELNTILKCAREGVSCIDATLFVTLSPCIQCAAMIKQSGINHVFYRNQYRDMSGVDFLVENGVQCSQI